MILKLEATAGAEIRASCDKAQSVADMLQITVEFEFNEVKCLASPGGSAELLAERQQEQQFEGPMDRRWAVSRP